MNRKLMKHPGTQEDPPQRRVRLYAMSLDCHSAIIHSTDTASLFESVCQFGIQSGVFDTLWISLMDAPSCGFTLQAHAGQPVEDLMHVPIDQVFRTVSENRPVWCNDLLSDPDAASYADLARQHGWRSCAVIPLTRANKPVAAIFLFAQREHSFDKAARKLLTQLADNISRTLEAFAHAVQHQQIESALLTSEVRYNALFASSSMPMLVVDPEPLRVVDANIRAVDFFKLNHVALVSHCGLDRAELQTDSALLGALEGLRHNTSQPAQFEFKYPALEAAQTLDLEVFCSPISVNDKRHFLLTFNDITARHQASETTRAMLHLKELGGELPEHEFLTKGLELAEALTHSHIGFLHFVNEDQESLELVTWTKGALQGCTAAHDTHYPISQAGIWVECVRERQPFVCNDYATYPAKRGLPPGHAELTRLISVPIFDQGRICLIMGVGNKTSAYEPSDLEKVQLIGNDLWRIARKARVEKTLQEKVTELESVNRQLLSSHMQLMQSEKLAAVGQLAAGVAHEINNPIAFINTNMGTLKIYMQSLLTLLGVYERCASPNSAADGAALERARRQADLDFLREDVPSLLSESSDGLERVKKIVLDLRDFARVDNEGWQESDLLAGLESTLNVARHELKYTVDIVKDLTPLPPVRCHLAQINQVFLNLLINAAQAVEGHGQITLRSGIEREWVWISVQDTGKGMTPEVQSRIFEPFFTTKPVGKGTGLGLSLSFDIVKKHGGRIQVSSTPGQGSCFQIWLPVAGPADTTP